MNENINENVVLKETEEQKRLMKKLKVEVAIIAILMICLCITTVALALSQVRVTNTFQTDAIDIILNNGQKIISDDDQSIAPGKTIVTTFPLKNNSNHDVYYRLFFANIKDGDANLADYLEVVIKRVDTGETIYEDLMPNLIRSKVKTVTAPLTAGEEIMLEASFYLPESAKNKLKGQGVTFDFVAEAVQAENNDDKDFGDVPDPIDPDIILDALNTTAPDTEEKEPEAADSDFPEVVEPDVTGGDSFDDEPYESEANFDTQSETDPTESDSFI